MQSISSYVVVLLLTLYNTMSWRKEAFASVDWKVRVYVCGITPYGAAHLGHAASYVFFDVLIRYLRHLGFKVKCVQNINDVDDRVLGKAKELGRDWKRFGEESVQGYLRDMRALNVLQPDVLCRSTDYVREMIELTKALLSKGLAYERNGNVYFDLSRDASFGKLSRLSHKEMIRSANEDGNFPADSLKKDTLDFVLWQRSKAGEPSWNSPFGVGRPGQHLGCSAASMRYLGQTLDIHGCGVDLLFPHNDCELAQSENVSSKELSRFWVHNALVRLSGKKMSTSGSRILIFDILKRYSCNAVRLLILSHHHRQAWDFEEEQIINAERTNRLFTLAWVKRSSLTSNLSVRHYRAEFFNALNDDMNTPKAIAVLRKLSKRVIRSKGRNVSGAKAFLNEAFNVLGLQINYV